MPLGTASKVVCRPEPLRSSSEYLQNARIPRSIPSPRVAKAKSSERVVFHCRQLPDVALKFHSVESIARLPHPGDSYGLYAGGENLPKNRIVVVATANTAISPMSRNPCAFGFVAEIKRRLRFELFG